MKTEDVDIIRVFQSKAAGFHTARILGSMNAFDHDRSKIMDEVRNGAVVLVHASSQDFILLPPDRALALLEKETVKLVTASAKDYHNAGGQFMAQVREKKAALGLTRRGILQVVMLDYNLALSLLKDHDQPSQIKSAELLRFVQGEIRTAESLGHGVSITLSPDGNLQVFIAPTPAKQDAAQPVP